MEIPIQLKKVGDEGGVVEWLRPPESGPEREIYLDFFQRGTLFNEAEFNRIIIKYSPQGTLDMDQYRKDYPAHTSSASYPKEVGGNPDKKIAYIVRNHPELIAPFELAALYDSKNPIKTQNGLSRQENLLHIIENSIFDRLLGDMIYSKSHFGEHVRRGEIGELYILDFKFLKEINAGMTYADADMEIKGLWDRIKSTLSEDDRKKIIVSRFAGAFYIGVRKGEHLLNSEGLRGIHAVTLFNRDGEGIPPTVPVGFSRQRIYPHELKEYYKTISRAENNSDAYFYTKLVEDIINSSVNDATFMKALTNVDIGEIEMRKEYRILSKPELYSLLLKGKRKEARIQKIKECVHSGAQASAVAYITQKRHSQMEINHFVHRVRDIRDELLSDLEKSLSKTS